MCNYGDQIQIHRVKYFNRQALRPGCSPWLCVVWLWGEQRQVTQLQWLTSALFWHHAQALCLVLSLKRIQVQDPENTERAVGYRFSLRWRNAGFICLGLLLHPRRRRVGEVMLTRRSASTPAHSGRNQQSLTSHCSPIPKSSLFAVLPVSCRVEVQWLARQDRPEAV